MLSIGRTTIHWISTAPTPTGTWGKLQITYPFFCKNVVFLTQAEYSYFSYVCSIVMDYITQKTMKSEIVRSLKPLGSWAVKPSVLLRVFYLLRANLVQLNLLRSAGFSLHFTPGLPSAFYNDRQLHHEQRFLYGKR